jgi:hypothetical protein
MQNRGDRQTQARRTMRRGRGVERRRHRARSLAFVMLLALSLALAAGMAPTGQARSAVAGSDEQAGVAPAKALREERAAARQAVREAGQRARARRQEERTSARGKAFSTERDNGAVRFSCSQVTVSYKNFPDLAGNAVTELVKIDKVRGISSHFSFDGPTGSHSIALVTPPGTYQVDVFAKWRTNSSKGAFDVHSKVSCSGSAFTIEKLQRIDGAGGVYTTAPLTGYVGQTVEYEIVVKNTGYLPLSFSDFTDAHCGTGTLTGGPGSEALAHDATTTYLCKHTLSAADLAAGSYTNTATDRGSPPAGEGAPITHTSNTVVVEMVAGTPPPEEKTTPEEKQNPPGETGKTSSGTTNPAGGTLAANVSSPLRYPFALGPQSGVLAFAARAVPALRGPGGCMRGRFAASLRSIGVKSVTFYLDGHKLKTLGSANARKGQLTITLDASRLKVGPHRLLARITMIPAASVAKAAHASRALTFVRCRPAAVDPKFTG